MQGRHRDVKEGWCIDAWLAGVGVSRRAFSPPFRILDCVFRLVFLVLLLFNLLDVFSFFLSRFGVFLVLLLRLVSHRHVTGGLFLKLYQVQYMRG